MSERGNATVTFLAIHALMLVWLGFDLFASARSVARDAVEPHCAQQRHRKTRRDQQPQAHDALTDFEIMECIDADGRFARWPAIGDGNAIRMCVHAFPQHGHSRPSQRPYDGSRPDDDTPRHHRSISRNRASARAPRPNFYYAKPLRPPGSP